MLGAQSKSTVSFLAQGLCIPEIIFSRLKCALLNNVMFKIELLRNLKELVVVVLWMDSL